MERKKYLEYRKEKLIDNDLIKFLCKLDKNCKLNDNEIDFYLNQIPSRILDKMIQINYKHWVNILDIYFNINLIIKNNKEIKII